MEDPNFIVYANNSAWYCETMDEAVALAATLRDEGPLWTGISVKNMETGETTDL